MYTSTLFLALLPLVSAHFKLTWPPARGFDEDTLSTFPCGGQNTVSPNRTSIPMSNFPIQLDMEHTSVHAQVLLAIGNDPGDNFDIVLVPTVAEQGPDNFCFGGVTLPSGLNISEGTNATIQVVTNGDPSGGLYNCADVTFTSTPLSSADYSANCQNSTGVTATYDASFGNANQSSSDANSSSTASGSAGAASATSSGLAAQNTMAAWALGAMGVAGALAAL